ncbi:hypothetical protein Hanom_Chr16g01452051 [Helianthus anomalus]
MYIYMEPIKSNHFLNQFLPSDHAEINSQPFKLIKLTAPVVVHNSFLQFLSGWFYSTFF